MASIISFLYLSLFFLTPLLFTSFTSELFELPKMYFVYLLSSLILLCHLVNWLKGKVPLFVKNRLTLPLLLFFLSQLLSTIFSVDVHTSIFGYYSRLNGGLLSLISYLILYFILSVYLQPKLKNKIITTSLLSGLLVALYGILEHFGIDKNLWVQDVQSRVFSTLGQPNWLAAYLCLLLPLALDRFITSKSKLLSPFYFLLFTIYYLCLLFTKSKSGIIAAIISISIYYIFYFFKNKKPNLNDKNISPFSRGIKGVLLLIIFVIFSITISNPIKDYLFPPKTTSTPANSSINITPSGDIRKIVWQGSLALWRQFPFFGTGPETFAYSYYWTRPAAHNLTSEWDFLYNKAHNEYLNYLATTGTLGFLTYLLFIITVIILLCKSIFSPPLSQPKADPSLAEKEGSGVDFHLAILASFVSILITNIAGFSVVITSLYFFLLPAFVSPELPAKADLKSKNKLFFIPLIIFFLYLLYKIFTFFLADITYSQSLTALDRQEYKNAQSFINLSLSLRPDEALYSSHAALVAAKLNQFDVASAYSNRAIALSPASTNLWKERAQLFSLLSLNDTTYFAYAIDALEKCAQLAPTDAKTFYLLGKFYDAASSEDKAISNYLHALDLKSNYDHAAFALGEIYFHQKKYSEAKTYFEITLKYAPNNSDAQNYLKQITSLLPKSH